MHCIGVRLNGPNWHEFSHHYHDYAAYNVAVRRYNDIARARRIEQDAEWSESAPGTRKTKVKSEDRTYKAKEKMFLFDSEALDDLAQFCAPCYHREVIGEDERKMYRELPADDWLITTVFEGTSLKETPGDIEKINNYLVNIFGIRAEIVTGASKTDKTQMFRDQIAAKYMPMSKVSIYDILL
jgi:hypothetical protein